MAYALNVANKSEQHCELLRLVPRGDLGGLGMYQLLGRIPQFSSIGEASSNYYRIELNAAR